MPNRRKGPRPYLRERKGREAVWVIRDGQKEKLIGARGISDEEIDRALAEYIGEKHQWDTGERNPANIQIADVLSMYAENYAIHHAAPELVGYHMKALLPFWGGKSLADVKGATCREYLSHRTSARKSSEPSTASKRSPNSSVKSSTVRRELDTLQAAINCWHEESPLDSVPKVVKPPPSVPRQRYLTRNEVARLLWACRKRKANYVARFILIGLYTGTRHNAILRLRWNPSLSGGYADLKRGYIFRRGSAERETSKKRPPVACPVRLLGAMARWHRMDEKALPHATIIHHGGAALAKMKRAWKSVVKSAGLGPDVTPHVLRHTCATWNLWAGKTVWDVAGMLGTSAAMIEKVYGHHYSPAPESGAKLGQEPKREMRRAG